MLARALSAKRFYGAALQLYRKLVPRDYRGLRDVSAFSQAPGDGVFVVAPRRCVPTVVRGELAACVSALALMQAKEGVPSTEKEETQSSTSATRPAVSAVPRISLERAAEMHRCILVDSTAVLSEIRLPVAAPLAPSRVSSASSASAASSASTASSDSAAANTGEAAETKSSPSNARPRPPYRAVIEQIRMRFCSPLQILRSATAARRGDAEYEAAQCVAHSLSQLLIAQYDAKAAAAPKPVNDASAAATKKKKKKKNKTTTTAAGKPELLAAQLLAHEYKLEFKHTAAGSASVTIAGARSLRFDPRTKNTPGKRRLIKPDLLASLASSSLHSINQNAANLASHRELC